MISREEAIERMKAHIDMRTSHTIMWGKCMDIGQGEKRDKDGKIIQRAAVDELAEWFVNEAFQAGLFEDYSNLHWLERTDGWYSQTGEFIRIQLAAYDEIEAQIQYLEEFTEPCVRDYVKIKGYPDGVTSWDYMESMRHMPLYIELKRRKPF